MIETLSSIEPLLFEDEVPRRLADLVLQIQQEVSRLERGWPADASQDIADVLGHVGGYYAILTERAGVRLGAPDAPPTGDEPVDTTPPSPAEARAEMMVLRAIDQAHAAGTLASPTSLAFLSWAHRSFYQAVAGPEGSVSTSGRLRQGSENSGPGDPVPQAPDRVGHFMDHFERRFGAAERWPIVRVIAIAAAHHRLNLIRPFPNGNGRVSRLMSHAMVLRAGIGGGGLWSISRGLARTQGDYRRMMRHAGSRRTGDRDGRGQLSATALAEFSEWMLSVMLEEIGSARASFAIETLEPRYRRLLRALDYDENAQDLAGAILRFGQIDRGDAPVVLKTSERTARNALSRLVQGGFLISATPKGPVRIAFPAEHRAQLFPQLFAEAPLDPLSLRGSSIGTAHAWDTGSASRPRQRRP